MPPSQHVGDGCDVSSAPDPQVLDCHLQQLAAALLQLTFFNRLCCLPGARNLCLEHVLTTPQSFIGAGLPSLLCQIRCSCFWAQAGKAAWDLWELSPRKYRSCSKRASWGVVGEGSQGTLGTQMKIWKEPWFLVHSHMLLPC